MNEADRAVAELVKRRFLLWRDVVQAGDFVRGSVVILRRPCVRKTCGRCASGEKHPATYLSIKVKGKTRLVYLPKAWVAQAKGWTAEWRRLEGLLGQMSLVNVELLRLLPKREAKRQRKERR
ncbi:MAG: hypothetical protein PHQ12_14660 [Chthoniobacteraceae bacterium]|nr:hypothetical protein [Chthoniobacteraceae bacterium]